MVHRWELGNLRIGRMRVVFGVLVWLLALVVPGLSQSVLQSGDITPRHVPNWVTNGVIGDGGTAADSPITTLGVTSNTQAGFCVSSGRNTAAGRQQLCFGAPLGSNAVISLQNYGTAAAQGLTFVINGVVVSLPSTGGDFITGTGPYAAGGVPCFSGTTSAVTNCGLVLSGGTISTGVWNGTAIGLGFGGTGATSAVAARTNLGLGTMSTQNANAVAVTGGTITGIPTPSAATDVAIKSYVDALATGLNILAQSRLASAAVLPNTPTYANGTLGVGATLTAGSNTTLTVDGTVAALNDVVLVKNQASAFQNGIYTVTTAGSGAAAWVLTRATYFDQAAEMKTGSYTFVTAGATNISSAWTLQTAVTTVGTDALTFNLFTSSAAGSVLSFNGRSGVVSPASNDYTPILTNSVGVVSVQSFCPAGGFCSTNVAANSTGTYTARTGLLYAIVECVGSGGGSGGAGGSVGNVISGGGGGSGGYSRTILSAAAIGGSQVITIGAVGSAGATGGGNGSAGGSVSFGTFCIAAGGSGGGGATASNVGSGGPGAIQGTGAHAQPGAAGGTGAFSTAVGPIGLGGAGGSSMWGAGGQGVDTISGFSTAGVSGTGWGSGAAGGSANNVLSNVTGNVGTAGKVIVTEFSTQ